MDTVVVLCSFAAFLVVPGAIVLMLAGGAIAGVRRAKRIDATLAQVAARLGWTEPPGRVAAGTVQGREVVISALVEGVGRHRKRWLQIRIAAPRAELAPERMTEPVRGAWQAMGKAGALRLEEGHLQLRTPGWEHGPDTVAGAVTRLVKLAAALER